MGEDQPDNMGSNEGADLWGADFGAGNSNLEGNNEFAETNGGYAPDSAHDEFNANQLASENVVNKPKMGYAFEAPLNEEEKSRLAEIELEQQERMRGLQRKEEDEMAEKRAWQQKAREDLEDWYADRERDRVAKSKQNKEEEWAYLRTRDEHKNSKNPWEKIIDNVEINPTKYLGAKDVTRMRQAMLARKGDLKKNN